MVCAAARRATTRRLRASPETMRLSASRPRTPAAHAAAHPAARASMWATASWLTSGLAAAWHMEEVGHEPRRACEAAQDTPPIARRPPARSEGSGTLKPPQRRGRRTYCAIRCATQKFALNLRELASTSPYPTSPYPQQVHGAY